MISWMAQVKALATLETTLDTYLVDKAPRIPDNWREILVKVIPWINLVFFILTLPIILALFGLGAIATPFLLMAGEVGSTGGMTLALAVLAVSWVLEGMAIPGLFKRSRRGWTLVYISAIINGVYNLLTLNIIGAVLGTLVGLYLLFQVKGYYK